MPVELTRVEEFALLTLNRPEALNALSFAIIAEIGERLDAAARSDARALLVTGAGGKAFCAGADIKELQGRDGVAERHGIELGQAIFAKLERLPMPSVALINGFAFGGGLELAMACTFRLAAASARMGQPEIKLGLLPGYGGTQRLPRLVGEARALELILTGRTVEAMEALAIGLVHRVADGDLLAAGMAFARSFSNYSQPVLALARQAVQRASTTALGEGLRIEADLACLAFRTADAAEGMAAFAEKRSPVFRNR
jgi:enoyl-CoA hydratase